MTDHYFAPADDAGHSPRDVRFRMDGRTWTFASDSHVFSAGRLDPGTEVLLRDAPAPSGEVLLDLGCGYGPIACLLAQRLPGATVWAVDVNERARALTWHNAKALGYDAQITVAAPDDVPADVTFDAIWSNPPIRIGKPALHALLTHWLARLRPDGTAWLVVAKNLGSDSLARWLVEQGYACERYTSVRGYRLLKVRHGAR